MDCLVRHVRAQHREVLFEIINESERSRMKIVSKPDGEYVKNDISDGDDDEEEDEDDEEPEVVTGEVAPIVRLKTVKEHGPTFEIEEDEEEEMEVQEEEEEEGSTIFMSDTDLMDSISELLNLLIDKETLSEFGWPETSVEDVNLIFFFYFQIFYKFFFRF